MESAVSKFTVLESGHVHIKLTEMKKMSTRKQTGSPFTNPFDGDSSQKGTFSESSHVVYQIEGSEE